MSINRLLSEVDPAIAAVLQGEIRRQNEGLELIASENFVSHAVLEALGSVLTNKYAEGLPGRRYYGGCDWVDQAEQLAIDRSKALFQADHANVQPHSGAQANQAVYLAALKPGDTILGMNLSHGGHLTHGSPVNLSGMWFKVVQYGVDVETGYIDYDEVRRVALEHRPRLIIAGASAYPRVIDFARFRAIADEAGAVLMVDMAHIAGLIAADQHPSPVPHAQYVTTTTHKTLRGPRGGLVLCQSAYAKALDKAVFPGLQGGPLMHVIAAKAVALKEALEPTFRDYQRQIVANAKALAETLVKNGVPLVSGGTDNHLMLVDLKGWSISGKEAEEALGTVGITVNKNTVPNDPRKPFVTSGLRIGTPAVTTRGLREPHMVALGETIAAVLHTPRDEAVQTKARQLVDELCTAFPLYEYQRMKTTMKS